MGTLKVKVGSQYVAIPRGPRGEAGPANSLGIGTVTTGNPGDPASATITGTAPDQTLNLTLPQGDAGPAGSGGPPTGVITMFAGAAAPAGYLLCQGQELSRPIAAGGTTDDYAALWAVIGTTYGAPTTATFSLPDLRVRVPIGAGTGKTLGSTDLLAEASRNSRWSHSHGHNIYDNGTNWPTAGISWNSDEIDATFATDMKGQHDHTISNHPGHSHPVSIASPNLNLATNTTTGGSGSRITNGETHVHSGSTATTGGGHDHSGFTGVDTVGHFHSVSLSGIPTVGHNHTINVNTSGGSSDHTYAVVNYIIKT